MPRLHGISPVSQDSRSGLTARRNFSRRAIFERLYVRAVQFTPTLILMLDLNERPSLRCSASMLTSVVAQSWQLPATISIARLGIVGFNSPVRPSRHFPVAY